MKKRDFDPFDEDAILYLIEKSEGHPSTLNSLCYISLELVSAISPDAIITESIVREAWTKFPNKTIHHEAINWYKEKGLYQKQD